MLAIFAAVCAAATALRATAQNSHFSGAPTSRSSGSRPHRAPVPYPACALEQINNVLTPGLDYTPTFAASFASALGVCDCIHVRARAPARDAVVRGLLLRVLELVPAAAGSGQHHARVPRRERDRACGRSGGAVRARPLLLCGASASWRRCAPGRRLLSIQQGVVSLPGFESLSTTLSGYVSGGGLRRGAP
jgi:hypothetical protein